MPLSIISVPGVFVEINGWGILLTGESGIGKSELALNLLYRGHKLIADDVVAIAKNSENQLVGTCPSHLKGFLALPSIGIINVAQLFGTTVVSESQSLQLIIHLKALNTDERASVCRLQGEQSKQKLLDTWLPVCTIDTFPGRQLVTLVETLVLDRQLKSTGYDASKNFLEKHQQWLKNNVL
jgi:HPr kinase/phosphorylase